MIRFLILAISMSLSVASKADEITLTSKNLVEAYQKYSQQAEPERLVMEARKKEEGHFLRSFLPNFEASYLREAFKEDGLPAASSYGWDVQGRMSLFNGGRDFLEEKVRENKTNKAEADRRVKEQSVLQQIKKEFWSIVYNRSLIQTIEKALADNNQILKLAENRIKAGVASAVDRLDFKLNGIRLRQDLQRAKNEHRNSENLLSGLLMIPETSRLSVKEEMSDEHAILESLTKDKSKVAHNPTFASIQAQSEIESFQARKNDRWYLPKLDLYGGFERPSLRKDSSGFGLSQWYGGLELKLSLGEVATSIATTQAKDLEARGQNQLKVNTYKLNEASISSLSQNIMALHELFHEAESSIKEAEDYVVRVLKEYDKGVKNSIDALNATRQSYDARREGLAVLRDYKFAIVDYQALIGFN